MATKKSRAQEALVKNIKQYREYQRLTLEEFGNLIGYKRAAVCALEQRRMVPSFAMLIELTNVMHISLDTLLSNSKEKGQPTVIKALLDKKINELSEQKQKIVLEMLNLMEAL